MKKTIILLLTCILCAAIFTGCPQETPVNSEPEQVKEECIFYFDKETFDTQRKAWNESGIKNYQFTEKFGFEGFSFFRTTTVKNGIPEKADYFKYVNESTMGEPLSLAEIKERIDEKYMPSGILSTIDNIYNNIEQWYNEYKNKDLSEELQYGIYFIGRDIYYDKTYHIPISYNVKELTKENLELRLQGKPYATESWDEWGWADYIYFFKVLD